MSKVIELRANRAKTWEQAKKFLDEHRDEKGLLSAEDTQTYERMEQEIVDLGHEIERQERLDAMEREMQAATSKPLTSKPDGAKGEEKTGRASDEYKKNFWNAMRMKHPDRSITNALQIGTDSEGGYLCPDEYERRLIDGLKENNIFRQLATIIQTGSGEHKIPVVASHGSASWVDEEGAYQESDDSFGQLSISAYKLGTMIKVSEELLHDSVFDMESYIAGEFTRRIGNGEEEAFITGNGTGKPTGILHDTYGAQTGVTAGATDKITADELIDLYHSLLTPYRKNAVWLMNDSTVQYLRKLKDGNGQYLWQASLVAGQPDTILGRPVYVSRYTYAVAKRMSEMEEKRGGDFEWKSSKIPWMLRNIAYKGDILTHKTVVKDYISGKAVKNEGYREQYYLKGHHPAIIGEEQFENVQKILASRSKKWKEKRS